MVCVLEHGGGAGQLIRHFDIVALAGQHVSLCLHRFLLLVAQIAQSVVQDSPAGLRLRVWVADDVQYRNRLAVSSAERAQSAELAGAKGGDDGAEALLAGVAVGRICADELIGSADPVELFLGHEVEEGQLIVCSGLALERHAS